MKIIDHGTWTRYQPEAKPTDAPVTAMFLRRDSDGVDWYDYVRPNFLLTNPRKKTYNPEIDNAPLPAPNFRPGNIFCNIYYHPEFKVHIVGTAVRDPTMMCPIGQRVIEIVGFDGDDPHAEFGGKVYDHEAGTFTILVRPPISPSPLEQKILDRLDTITARLKELERKING
jgi:hypothetical protein